MTSPLNTDLGIPKAIAVVVKTSFLNFSISALVSEFFVSIVEISIPLEDTMALMSSCDNVLATFSAYSLLVTIFPLLSCNFRLAGILTFILGAFDLKPFIATFQPCSTNLLESFKSFISRGLEYLKCTTSVALNFLFTMYSSSSITILTFEYVRSFITLSSQSHSSAMYRLSFKFTIRHPSSSKIIIWMACFQKSVAF